MTGQVRLLPLVAFAALCLAVLKVAGLAVSGGYVLSGTAPASAQGRPGEAAGAAQPGPAPAGGLPAREAPGEARADRPAAEPRNDPAQSEREVLESLAQRRRALDQFERELTLRENLLRAAETRVEQRVDELKAIEARMQAEIKRQEEARTEEFERLVRTYTEMKPRDAARIMNRLDLEVLTAMVTEMHPRTMSAILAEMDSVVAQRVTLEIANRKTAPHPPDDRSVLPKIEGHGPS